MKRRRRGQGEMEVTSSNFQEVLEELEEVLKGSTFLAIDGEFTGLNSEAIVGIYDTPAQYYSKLRAGSMDFLLVQFGLAVFTYDDKTQRYSHKSYNFYVFPRPLNRTTTDCRFMCQASCISFLADQGFDFNKLFKCGIPYLTAMEEEKLMKKLEEKLKARASRDEGSTEIVPIPDSDKPLVEDVCRRIDEFVQSGFEGEELTIDKCNSYIRRLVHQEARIRWPNRLRIESRLEKFDYTLVVKKLGTKEEEERKELERRVREVAEVKRAVGLGLLMRKIVDSGKLIVGHNMLLDLCHMVHQFFGHLPESYAEFKSLLHGLFPRLLDTKVICHSQELRDSVVSSNLSVLFETVGKRPFRIPEMGPVVEGRTYSTSEVDKSHEAGYDAFLTGVCFVALSNRLGSLQDPPVDTVLPDSPLLHPFLNKLLIGRLKDMPYINITGDDPKPSREHVFHLTFPREWKFNDISQLFSPFGGIQVSWLSDTTAYVGLNRKEQAAAVAKNLKSKTNVYTIRRYREYQASLDVDGNETEKKQKLSKIVESGSGGSSSEKGESSGESKNANGAKEATAAAADDDGWEIVTGKRRRKRRQRTNTTDVPQKRKTFDDSVSWE
ncbi:poly(A)-specific ribonuclease PARN-like isoform X2 [Ceratina calcarata]|uniref:Poly(A)-specific ribonuclease PARN-like isoform X2 n=1 Tax=Ceratina calcarata TaxID=156304 RepID=A0AAJ7IXG3_9HYME|nr:poly(A)-specific ribonuclease PARN-like isoform X2 [Ceratina calcarata]